MNASLWRCTTRLIRPRLAPYFVDIEVAAPQVAMDDQVFDVVDLAVDVVEQRRVRIDQRVENDVQQLVAGELAIIGLRRADSSSSTDLSRATVSKNFGE